MHVKSNQDPCETWDFQTWLKYGAVMRRLTPEEAIALLPDEARIHTFVGVSGADMDRSDIETTIRDAEQQALTEHRDHLSQTERTSPGTPSRTSACCSSRLVSRPPGNPAQRT